GKKEEGIFYESGLAVSCTRAARPLLYSNSNFTDNSGECQLQRKWGSIRSGCLDLLGPCALH
ncbi:MAG: hypothetical protein PVJ82_04905, partial [Desulfobacteraceae bacterium]